MARVMADRVFGRHEAEAMFEAIGNALAVLGKSGEVSGRFLRELRAEREMLTDQRTRIHLALLRTGDDSTRVENALAILDPDEDDQNEGLEFDPTLYGNGASQEPTQRV